MAPEPGEALGPLRLWDLIRAAARRRDAAALDDIERSGIIADLADELPAGPPPRPVLRGQALLATARLALCSGARAEAFELAAEAVNGLSTRRWTPPTPWAAAEGPFQPLRFVDDLARFAPHPGLVALADLLADIAGRHDPGRSVGVGVLISRHADAAVADLTLCERPGAPGLYPDLTLSPFVRFDPDFEEALQRAWTAAGGPLRSVRWVLHWRDSGQPIDAIRGPSIGLGAAAGLLVLTGRLPAGSLAGRLVTGGIATDGQSVTLCGPGGDLGAYEAKLRAAGGRPVVLPAVDVAPVIAWADRQGLAVDLEGVARVDDLVPTDAGPLAAFGEGEDDEEAVCPYRGLTGYGQADADLFCGRDALVATLVGLVASRSFVGVVGASGVGKSSLVRAGLLARLAAGAVVGSEDWPIVAITPGPEPLARLAAALAAPAGGASGGPQAVDWLRAAVDGLLAERHPASRVVLVLDQFEELFSLARRDDADQLLGLVADAVGAGLRLAVVVVLRADFYGEVTRVPAFADLFEDHLLIRPMSEAELRRAISGPAAQAGLLLEPLLLDELVADATAQPGALPLLSTALEQTWARRRGRLLTVEGYRAAGAVHGALAKLAEATYAGASSAEQAAMRRLLLAMVTDHDATRLVRRPAPLDDLRRGEVRRHALERLVAHRLVTIGDSTAEIAHDALLSAWPTLHDWLNEDRPGRSLYRSVVDRAPLWKATGSAHVLEREPTRLTAARTWAADHPEETEDDELAFLAASAAALTRRARRTRAALATLAALLAVALVAGGLAFRSQRTAQAALGREQAARDEADRQADAARSAQAEAERQAGIATGAKADAETALANERLALDDARNQEQQKQVALDGQIAATDEAKRQTGRAQAALDVAEEQTRQKEAARAAEAVARTDADYQAAQATAARDLAIDQQRLAEIRRQEALIRGAAAQAVAAAGAEPDLAMLLAAQVLEQAADYEASTDSRLRNPLVGREARAAALAVRNGVPQLARFLDDDPQRHEGVTFALGDSRLVEAGESGTVGFYDAATGHLIGPPVQAHRGIVGLLRTSPDGRIVASGGHDGTVRLWDAATGQPTGRVFVHASDPAADPTTSFPITRVGGIVFAPDGTLYTAGDNGQIKHWDPATGALLSSVGDADHSGYLGLDLSPDGRVLVGALASGHIEVMNATTAALAVVSFCFWNTADFDNGFRNYMNEVRFDPRGQRFLTVQRSGRIAVWDVAKLMTSGCSATGYLIDRLSNGALDAAWSRDGSVVAVAGGQNEIYLYDGTSADLKVLPPITFAPLRGHNSSVRAVAVSSDGRRALSAGDDGRLAEWSVADQVGGGRRLRRAGDGLSTVSTRGSISASAISPDGTKAASVSGDGRLVIWSLTDGRPTLDVAAHPPTDQNAGCEASVLRAGATAVAWVDDTAVVTAGCDGQVIRWDVASGRVLERFGDLGGAGVADVTVNRSGGLLTAVSIDGRVLAIDLASGQRRVVDAKVSDDAPRVAANAAGTVIAVTDDEAVVLIDAATGARLGRLRNQIEPMFALTFSPDGAFLATGNRDQTVVVWNVASQQPVKAPLGNYDGIFGLSWLPSTSVLGPALVVASRDDTVHIVDLATGYDLLAPLRFHQADVMAVSVSPDGRRLVSGDSDGFVAAWDLSVDGFVEWACRTSGRDLTTQEWDSFLPGAPPRATCAL